MSVITMEKERFRRKVSKVGNSLGLTIPNELVKDIGISPGDEFEWGINEEGDIVAKRIRKAEIRKEVLEIFSEILEEDADLLWKLRDK